jgi:hypothetical protein
MGDFINRRRGIAFALGNCTVVTKDGDLSAVCQIVHWLGKGKGVVFKAGPGPLAEVGKLGVKGKTPCDGCPCMKPGKLKALEALKT